MVVGGSAFEWWWVRACGGGWVEGSCVCGVVGGGAVKWRWTAWSAGDWQVAA